ncbi:MAG TPA: hypothetical protein PLZ57_08135 [Pseudobdellovibrionaceae bacterium]|nr:hypothetical protein [Pseudobdellovibrionaceae bacterium]
MAKSIWGARVWILASVAVLAVSVALSGRGQAGESTPCMSEPDARATFKGHIDDLLRQVDEQWGIGVCQAEHETVWDDEVCVQRADVEAAAETLQWQATAQNFTSTSFLNWYCAPAAECWLYAAMSCTGEVELRHDGEE